MISAGDFRNGVTLEIDGNVVQIIEFQHVKPGKGAAFVRTKYKNIILLISSLLFYFYGEPIYILVMLATIVSAYIHRTFNGEIPKTEKNIFNYLCGA